MFLHAQIILLCIFDHVEPFFIYMNDIQHGIKSTFIILDEGFAILLLNSFKYEFMAFGCRQISLRLVWWKRVELWILRAFAVDLMLPLFLGGFLET